MATRRDALKAVGATALAAAAQRALGGVGAIGRALGSAIVQTNPMGANIAFGGGADTYFEDLPLFQDIIPWSKGFQVSTGAGTIGSTWATVDANGWPTQDFGVFLHVSGNSPSWASGALSCGYISRGSGTETIAGVGATVSSINRTAAPLVTFQLTPTATTWGMTITGTSGLGATGVYAYQNEYAANASNGHVDITAANVLAGKPIFTTEALALYKQLRHTRWMWGQNAWYNVGSTQITFASNPVAGAVGGTLNANSLAPGTYNVFFIPTTLPGGAPSSASLCADIRAITISSAGQTAISWSGGLNFGASAIVLPCTSATMHTAATVKANQGWGGSGYASEAYPPDWAFAWQRATGKGLWLHLPVFDDGTYWQALLQAIYANVPAGIPVNLEIGNELWNQVGTANIPFFGLAWQAFPSATSSNQAAGQYLATRWHAIANYGRTLFSSRWNTDIRLVAAWQIGTSAVLEAAFSYMVAQGWTPSADVWSASQAPYFVCSPHIAAADTVAQIQAKLVTGSTFPFATGGGAAPMNLESAIAVAYWYGLPGGMEAYECAWDSVTDFNHSSSNPNIGATILDTGTRSILANGYAAMRDMGFSVLTEFEFGTSSDTSNESPRYELTNTYGSEATSARFLAMQDAMAGTWTPSRNVVAAVGTTQIDARYVLNSSPTINSAYPTHASISAGSPINNYNVGWMIQVPIACTKIFKVYHTTTQSASFNAYLDGAQVATAVSIASGLSDQAVTYATLALSAGHHYLEIGKGAAASGITDITLEFD